MTSNAAPLWLWRLTRATLLIVIAAGVIAVIVLGAGAADPPRAGPIQYEDTTAHTLSIQVNSGAQVDSTAIALPDGPFTLEVSATFAPESDPGAAWGIALADDQPGAGNVRAIYSALLNGYRQYAVTPAKPDFAPFIHVRANGEANKITLDMRMGGITTLRINDELAWTGQIAAVHSARILMIGGLDRDATLTIQDTALYVAQ